MTLASTLRFILRHPLNEGRPLRAIGRFAQWQILSRVHGERVMPWVENAKLSVHRGMTGATGNIYCGLHEYSDMSFLLHLLRPGDVFADVGANVGSYTVLASAVCDAKSISIEPDPGTIGMLRRNVRVNGIDHLVRIEETAVGARSGTVSFTVGLDTVNRVSLDGSLPTRQVGLARLDDLVAKDVPVLIKLDVEGYEREVFEGSKETLADDRVVAILTEDQGAEVANLLARHGFERLAYHPESRRLVPPQEARGGNGLFVRRRSWVQERLMGAPARRCGPYRV